MKDKGVQAAGSDGGVWRDGKWLVMSRSAALPGRCVKCNEPAHEPVKVRKVYWHHPLIYLLFFLYGLIYIIVALIVRKRADVNAGLCAEHKSKRRNAILLAWAGMLSAIVLPIGFAQGTEYVDAWILFCTLLFFGSAIAGIVLSRVVYAKKIDNERARLGGCGTEFLDSLPDFPGH